jgi:tetratricopeptide (TPR) repeat protein
MAEQSRDRSLIALVHESIGSVFFYQEQFPDALEEYRKDLDLSADAEHIGYASLSYGNALRILGRFSEAQNAFARAESSAERFLPLSLNLVLARAEMSLNRNLYSDAIRVARRAATSKTDSVLLTSADLQRVLGLALIASGAKNEGLRLCTASLELALKSNDAAAVFRERLALLQALVESANREQALHLFRVLEPELPNHPESRWRALALMARLKSEYALPARQELEKLRSWGEPAYQTYLARPDVQKLSWPLFIRVHADSN